MPLLIGLVNQYSDKTLSTCRAVSRLPYYPVQVTLSHVYYSSHLAALGPTSSSFCQPMVPSLKPACQRCTRVRQTCTHHVATLKTWTSLFSSSPNDLAGTTAWNQAYRKDQLKFTCETGSTLNAKPDECKAQIKDVWRSHEGFAKRKHRGSTCVAHSLLRHQAWESKVPTSPQHAPRIGTPEKGKLSKKHSYKR